MTKMSFFLKYTRQGKVIFLEMLRLYINIPFMQKSGFEKKKKSYDSFALR